MDSDHNWIFYEFLKLLKNEQRPYTMYSHVPSTTDGISSKRVNFIMID